MQFFQFKTKDILSLVITMALAFVIIFLSTFANVFDRFELNSENFRFFLRKSFEDRRNKKLGEGAMLIHSNARAHPDIVIIGIDEDTIREFDKVEVYWPFPWQVHAQFVDFLATGNLNSIVFDIMFLEHKQGEADMADAFRRAGNIIIDYSFDPLLFKKRDDQDQRIAALNANSSIPVTSNIQMKNYMQEIIPPTPDLITSSRWAGFANVIPDQDKIIRRSLLVMEFEGRYYLSVVLATVLNYYGLSKEDVEVVPGKYVKIKNVPPDKLAVKTADNSITIPIDEQGFMDTNYIGDQNSFNMIPYYLFCRDASEGPLPGFDNKIALVAAYAASGIADDVKQSPYGEMYGIEHHANAINTILKQDFLHRPTDNQILLVLLVIGLMLGLILPRINIILSSIITTLGAFGYFYYTNFYLFEEKNFIMPFVAPVTLIILCFISVTVVRVVSEQSEKQVIRKTFSRFVSKSVVDELLKDPKKVKLGGEKKVITVLFSDIRGFTTISEGMPPEQLVVLLNEYLEAMTEIVIKYNGTLDKYIGDAIMAFWGAPIPQEDHALLCCKAAVEMISGLNRLNDKWKSEGKAPLKIGIGINSGDMVVANMGSSSRMDYTLIGDEVNTGSRLEGTNKVYGTEIIISDKTYAMVRDHVIVRELDYVRVKGKKLPVYLYELLDMI